MPIFTSSKIDACWTDAAGAASSVTVEIETGGTVAFTASNASGMSTELFRDFIYEALRRLDIERTEDAVFADERALRDAERAAAEAARADATPASK